MIMGESGSGKSSGVRTLPPKETFVFNTLGKDLPFRGSGKLYTIWNKETNPNGNMLKTSNSQVVMQWLDYIDKKMPQIKYVVIDDNTHQSSLEYMRRLGEKTFDKFNDIADNMINIAQKAASLRDDLTVFILHHVTETGDGILEEKKLKAQTVGKLVNNLLGSYEAFFTVILLATKVKGENGEPEYYYLTRDANSTIKTPMGMFDESKVPNDLLLLSSTIRAYYEAEVQ